jgi:hypothetical protein
MEVHYGWVQKHLQEMMGFQVCSHQVVGVESTTICFELEFLGFSSVCYLSYYWSFRGSPAFYSDIVVLGTSTKLSLQCNPSRIISDWFEGSVLLQSSRPLLVQYLTKYQHELGN